MAALPPATLEGWYVLHQVFTQDWGALAELPPERRESIAEELREFARTAAEPGGGGWSAGFRLVGGGGDWLWVHLRPTLEELADVQLRMRRSEFGPSMWLEYDYISVTEAGLYHATAAAAKEHEPGSEAFAEAVAEAAAAERASGHVQTRLFPGPQLDKPYISFYPMSKRRAHPDNWYSLPVDERNRLMREHGLTGRRYAGKIFQIITGSVGLDDWEWGVTLFAGDPLDFKRIVTEMRYDEASARYGEFGSFYTGIRVAPDDWPGLIAGG